MGPGLKGYTLGLLDRLKGIYWVMGSIFSGVPRTTLTSSKAARVVGPSVSMWDF